MMLVVQLYVSMRVSNRNKAHLGSKSHLRNKNKNLLKMKH